MNPTMTPTRTLIATVSALILLLFGATPAVAQNYTISPSPFLLAQNNAGAIINNACVWTYNAGTTTAATTYSDTSGTPNLNPIRSDSAGRFTAYLLAGTNYKFVYETACVPPAHGTTLRTADNIAGVPASAATVDVTGTAGETISAGQCAYLSDGSASKTTGQWYKCDSTTAYSSTTPEVGIAPSAIVSGASGTIRLAGPVTGLSSLAVGSSYYASTAGAITTTAPTLRRFLGVADSATSIVLNGNPPPHATAQSFSCGRLTLTTATPVTTSDVTAATTVYLTPIGGCNLYTVWDGTKTVTDVLTETSVAVPATTSQMYDVFAFDNNGAINIEVLAWTNDTTRATAITIQNGFYAKSGTATRKYVGSFRTTTVSGQTEDSVTKRFVWNYYNRVRRDVRVDDATANWNYTTATWRQARATTTNQIALVAGVAEGVIHLQVSTTALNTTANIAIAIAIGEDSTTTPSAKSAGGANATSVVNIDVPLVSTFDGMPAAGYHFYAWLEFSTATGVTTWRGSGNLIASLKSGIVGWIEG